MIIKIIDFNYMEDKFKNFLFDSLENEIGFLKESFENNTCYTCNHKKIMKYLFNDEDSSILFIKIKSIDESGKLLKQILNNQKNQNIHLITMSSESDIQRLSESDEIKSRNIVIESEMFLNRLIILVPYVFLYCVYTYKDSENLMSARQIERNINNIKELMNFYSANKNTEDSKRLDETQVALNYCKFIQTFEVIRRYHRKFVLALGAGVSIASGAVPWDNLIANLEQPLNEIHLNCTEIEKYIGDNQLATAELCKIGYSDDKNYYKKIQESIYGTPTGSNDYTLKAISDCVEHNKKTIEILTYNYDNYLEMELTKRKIEYTTYYDSNYIDDCKVPIYHVHGYLPKNIGEKKSIDKNYYNSIILTEDEYNNLYDDAYSWSIEKQLELFRSCTCVFVGHSLRDHNVKRLLELSKKSAYIKNNAACIHFAIMKNDNKFSKIDEAYIEYYYMLFNIRILWITKFEQIPNILQMINCN